MKKMLLILIIGMLLITTCCIQPIVKGCAFNQRIKNFNSIFSFRENTQLNSNTSQFNLKPGDIVWRWSFIPMITHCMLFVGINNENKYEFIEANAMENVWLPTYDVEWINYELFDLIVRVNASQDKIDGALDFAREQVGKKFEYIHEKEFNPDTEYWYCAEVIWASFYSQGIDIDFNGWEDNYIFQYPVIMPFEIYFDEDVEVYQLYNS